MNYTIQVRDPYTKGIITDEAGNENMISFDYHSESVREWERLADEVLLNEGWMRTSPWDDNEATVAPLVTTDYLCQCNTCGGEGRMFGCEACEGRGEWRASSHEYGVTEEGLLNDYLTHASYSVIQCIKGVLSPELLAARDGKIFEECGGYDGGLTEELVQATAEDSGLAVAEVRESIERQFIREGLASA